MKQINFIKTVPLSEERAVRFWYRGSLIGCVLSILFMSFFYIYQLYIINNLKTMKKGLASCLQEYEHSRKQKKIGKKKKEIYEQQVQKVDFYVKSSCAMHDLIQAITTVSMHKGLNIHAVTVQKDCLTLRVQCSYPEMMVRFVEELSNMSLLCTELGRNNVSSIMLRNVMLTSLEKRSHDCLDTPFFIGTITATVNTGRVNK